MAVKLKLQREPSDGVHQSGTLQIGGVEERFTVHVKEIGVGAIYRDEFGELCPVVVLLEVNIYECVVFSGLFVFACFTAKPQAGCDG